MRRFISHTPPGYDFATRERDNTEAYIADVHWYGTARKSMAGQAARLALDGAGRDKLTGLPVVKRSRR